MKLAILAAVFVSLASCGGCASVPQPGTERDVALRLEFDHGRMRGICSGTAVAPDTLETAAHCMGDPLSTVNGVPAKVVRSQLIAPDRLRVVVSGVTFKRWVRLGKAVQGQRVHWWGQPLGVPFVYREGVVALVTGDGLIVDATICHGDSGSGLLDDAGDLVGVVSFMTDPNGCTFLGAH